ncbi:MAG: zf-HC2 domain-containing protein [Acidimicrobiales bacterium]
MSDLHDIDDARRDRLCAEALGTLDGRERASLRAHLATCERCSHDLAEMSATVDAVSLAAPDVEPPVGFESSVLARIDAERVRPLRLRRVGVLLAAAAAVVAFVGGWAVHAATSHPGATSAIERSLTSNGVVVGSLYAVAGHPAWMVVSTNARAAGVSVNCVLVERDGATAALGRFALDTAGASWSVRLPVALDDVRGVRLIGPNGRLVATTSASTWS